MKNLYFLILFLVFYGEVFCQTPSLTPFAYGVSFGGNISFGKPKDMAANAFEKKNTPGYHLGFVVSFRKPKYYLETGAEYLAEGYKYKTMNTEITQPTINYFTTENKFFSLAVPLKLCVPFQDRYVTHLLSFGIIPKLMLKQTHFKQINYKNGTIEEEILNEKAEYSSFYPSIHLAYGLEIPVNYNEESIRIEPYAQFSFINAKSQNLSNTISGFGLRASFLWLN